MDKIVNIAGESEIPEGWYFKRYLNTTYGVWGTPVTTVVITDSPSSDDLHENNPNFNHVDSSDLLGDGAIYAEQDYGEYHPHYYQTESGIQPWDVIKTFNLDYWRGSMVAYLCRMGQKPGNSELDDMRKVYTFAAERIRQLETEAAPVKVLHRCIQGQCNEHAGDSPE